MLLYIYISSWHDLVDVVGTRGWLACKAPPNETEFFSSTGTRCLPQSRFCSWGGPVDRGLKYGGTSCLIIL